jgi:hypothetical protein
MSDNYAHVARDATQFFVRVSAETTALNTKIIGYADRMGRITKRDNPVEYDAIIRESAGDLKVYAQRVEGLFPDYRRNLALLTQGFEARLNSLDRNTETEAQELRDMRREAQTLAETAREVKPKITNMRDALTTIRDSNHDPRLTQAAQSVITTTAALLTAYDDLETFALKVSFSADEK